MGERPRRSRLGFAAMGLVSLLWGCVVPFKPGEGTSGTGGSGTGGNGTGSTSTASNGTASTSTASTGTGGPCGGPGEVCCASGVCNDPALACDAGKCLGCAADIFAGEGSGGPCSLRKDGALLCWGSNSYSTIDCSGGPYFPTVIPGLGSVTHASVGEHVCAFGAGDLRCWGANGRGQCGTAPFSSGEQLCPSQLVTVALQSPVVEVATTYYSTTVALLSDGRVFGWGSNNLGQLGINGTYDGNAHPTPLELTQFFGSNNHDIAANARVTCAASISGAVRCMGDNQDGGLGTSQFLPYGSVADLTLSGVDALFAGTSFMCALKGGEAWCWGDNFYMQLGKPTVQPSPDAVHVVLGRPIKQLSTGGEHACAILDDDTVWCWGNNDYFQLGHCASGDRPPTQVFLDTSKTIPLKAKHIAAAQPSTCAVDLLDRIYCWGRNNTLQSGIENGKMNVCPPEPVAMTCM